jgi:hypothetical protein
MKIFVRLLIALAFWSLPALAQEDHGKNEVGLVIGATVTPSQTLAPGPSLIGSGGIVVSSRNLGFNPSLSLGAEYDRRFVTTRRFAV